jgi:type III restriction enzyme
MRYQGMKSYETSIRPNLDFQREAINVVVDIFEGQQICRTNFTVAPLKQLDGLFAGMDQNDLGIGNRLRLLDEHIHGNVKAIQLRKGLAPSETFKSMDFTVEMETGIGKTYVYLRTIFEMNRLYGFTKFILSCPRWPSKRASTSPSR